MVERQRAVQPRKRDVTYMTERVFDYVMKIIILNRAEHTLAYPTKLRL